MNFSQHTDIGYRHGHKIEVDTDSIGSQISYSIHNEKRIDQIIPLACDHMKACKIARKVKQFGMTAANWQH